MTEEQASPPEGVVPPSRIAKGVTTRVAQL